MKNQNINRVLKSRIVVAGLLESSYENPSHQTEDTEKLDVKRLVSLIHTSRVAPVHLRRRSLPTNIVSAPLCTITSSLPSGPTAGAVSGSSRHLSFTLLLRSYITQALVIPPQPSVILTLFNIHSQREKLLRGSAARFNPLTAETTPRFCFCSEDELKIRPKTKNGSKHKHESLKNL